MDRRFIDHLVEKGLVTRQQMQRVILLSSKEQRGLVSQLVEAGTVSQERIAEELGRFYHLEVFEAGTPLNIDAASVLSEEVAQSAGVLPFDRKGEQLCVCIFDLDRAQRALVQIEDSTGHNPVVSVGPRDLVLSLIKRAYGAPAEASPSSQKVTPGQLGRIQPRRIAVPRSKEKASADPVEDALNAFDDLLDEDPAVSSPRGGFAPRAPSPRAQAQAEPEPAPREDEQWESASTSVSSWSWDDFDSDEGSPKKSGSKEKSKGPGSKGQKKDSFSLFEISDVYSEEVSIEERLEEQTKALHALESELERQRHVIQALADILIGEGVVNRRALARKIKEQRRKG